MTKQLNLRLSNEMHSALVTVAARNHRSLNGEIETAIDQHLQREALVGKKVRHRDGDPANSDPSNLELEN